MTNIEGEKDTAHDHRLAALLAVNLVSQVLDEANVIANAAYDSGKPWKYVSGLKKLSRSLNETYDKDNNVLTLTGDKENFNESKINISSNVMTSTPQKSSDFFKIEHSLIGQGDEVFIDDNDTTKSTSILINNLFDMSDVEQLAYCDETDTRDKIEPNEMVTNAMKKIMESFIDSALSCAFGEGISVVRTESTKLSETSVHSSYSYLADAPICSLKDDSNKDGECSNSVSVENHDLNIDKVDFASYEKSFLTLNRDVEECSENDEEPIVLQDPNPLSLQEIDLINAGSTENNLDKGQNMEFAAISKVSTSASKRSSLVRRCRSQGARLLACLRGWWWKRRVLGKRRESRLDGSSRGMCPISPEARRRAASVLEHRRSPSPHSVVWKFNTVNEALVHSSRWKEITSNI